jgi:hypothetical protein
MTSPLMKRWHPVRTDGSIRLRLVQVAFVTEVRCLGIARGLSAGLLACAVKRLPGSAPGAKRQGADPGQRPLAAALKAY